MTEYIYRFHKLFPGHIDVPEDTLICYDVRSEDPGSLAKYIQGTKATSWSFSVRGREGRFVTHYDWSLVRNSPENLSRLTHIRQLQQQREQLLKQIENESKQLDTAAKDIAKQSEPAAEAEKG